MEFTDADSHHVYETLANFAPGDYGFTIRADTTEIKIASVCSDWNEPVVEEEEEEVFYDAQDTPCPTPELMGDDVIDVIDGAGSHAGAASLATLVVAATLTQLM